MKKGNGILCLAMLLALGVPSQVMGMEIQEMNSGEIILETENESSVAKELITDIKTEGDILLDLPREEVIQDKIEEETNTEELSEMGRYEQVEAFVKRLYSKVLGRAYDPEGLENWTSQLYTQANTGAGVANGFICSEELTKRNLTNDAYVEMLYETFLDRGSDGEGKANWISLLEKGVSRNYIFKGFAESNEFTNICREYGINRGNVNLTEARDQNAEVTMFVYRCYQQFLGRTADVEGLNNWCQSLLSGQNNAKEVAQGFVFSNEFNDKGYNNSDYVKIMYRGLFDREADPEGLNGWVKKLNIGYDKMSIFNGFADSQEFRNLVAFFGLDNSWDNGLSEGLSYSTAKSIYTDYLNKTLVRSFGKANVGSYGSTTSATLWYYGWCQSNGIISATVDDFDADNQYEMVLAYLTSNYGANSKIGTIKQLHLASYSLENGVPVQKSDEIIDSLFDVTNMYSNMYVTESDGNKYIYYEKIDQPVQGTEGSYYVMNIENKKVNLVRAWRNPGFTSCIALYASYSGWDFSDLNEKYFNSNGQILYTGTISGTMTGGFYGSYDEAIRHELSPFGINMVEGNVSLFTKWINLGSGTKIFNATANRSYSQYAKTYSYTSRLDDYTGLH